MASSFDSYRQDLERGLKQVSASVERLKRTPALVSAEDDTDNVLRRCKTNLQNLRQFSMPSNSPEAYSILKLTADLARVENEWKQGQKLLLLHTQASGSNSGSLSTPLLLQPSSVETDRNRALRANQVLDHTSHLIRDMSTVLGETNQIGQATLQELHLQGEDLHEVRGDLQESRSAAKSAAQALKRMASRAFYNRVFLLTIIALLVVVDAAFLWFGFIQG
ncbi:hypothetical protein BASA81_005892 [Batrachochytrium salamandrivorans]|nr:hypothetical protein BASA81_005892 [Batrachochytrium salamandrivorans]